MMESVYHVACRMLDRTFTDARGLLEQSLFYYCSGRDPTPVVAFGAEYPLYVYVDSLVYQRQGLDGTVRELYRRLRESGFLMTESLRLSVEDAPLLKGAEVSLWETKTGERFLLLFLQADAEKGFCCLYGGREDYALPRCVCNYRYEMPRRGVLEEVEERVPFVMGHCFNRRYRCVGQYGYLGDYGDRETVKLYRRSVEDED
jgi:hypothetical protein